MKHFKSYVLVLAVACLSFLPGLGSYKMLDPTDSFFIEAAREMLELSHFVTPLINYSDWLDKPTLPLILIIASFKAFGVNEWAGRIPSALSAVILVIFTFATVKRLVGLRAAVLAGLVLCTSPLYLIVAHVALTDMPLSMFIGISMLAFAQALIAKNRSSLVFAYLALALAVLCKGPIGLILVAGSLAVYLICTSSSSKQLFDKLKILNLPLGMLGLVLTNLPYYLLAHYTTGGAFTNAFFLRQNLGRFAGVVNHQEPIWFYVPVFLGGYFPWTVYLLASTSRFRRFWSHRFHSGNRQELTGFCWSWLLFILVLFTIVPTKLPTYIVPISPALAILVGLYLQSLIKLKQRPAFLTLGAITLTVSAAGLVILAKVLLLWPGQGSSVILLNVLFWIAGGIIVLGQLIALILLRQRLISQALWTILLGTYLGVSTIVPVAFCRFYQIRQAGLSELIQLAKSRQASLATLFCLIPSANFCLRKRVVVVNSLAELSAFCCQGTSPHWLLATKNCLAIPELQASRRIIASDGKWYLLSVDGYPSKKSK